MAIIVAVDMADGGGGGSGGSGRMHSHLFAPSAVENLKGK